MIFVRRRSSPKSRSSMFVVRVAADARSAAASDLNLLHYDTSFGEGGCYLTCALHVIDLAQK
jgi:hypothetical protein